MRRRFIFSLVLAGCDPELGGDGDQPHSADPAVQEMLAVCGEERPDACPAGGSLQAGGGLVPIDHCGFELVDQDTWATRANALDALGEYLPEVELRVVLDDLDRAGVVTDESNKELASLEHMRHAFTWDSADSKTPEWMPQGVSGSADAFDDGKLDERRVVAVSWYHKPEESADPGVNKGVRVSFVDVTDIDEGVVPYRHVLLVEPFEDGGGPDFRAVKIHAGGIAWAGRYLYVADTVRGLRVFDTARVFAVDGDADDIGRGGAGKYSAYGYGYVMPQVGAYYLDEGSCSTKFSFVSLDQTSYPRALVTGEYHDWDLAGRLMRWAVDDRGLLVTDEETLSTHPLEAYFAQEDGVQGAITINDEWWLSCSGQVKGGHGLLYRRAVEAAVSEHGWVFGPEDLMFSPSEGLLWSASEFSGRRFVFSIDTEELDR